MKLIRYLFMLFIWCSPAGLLAQVSDTGLVKVKYPAAEYFQEKDFNTINTFYSTLDTLPEGVQKYFPNNFTYSLGLAGRILTLIPTYEIGFRSGFNNLDLFGYNKAAVNYYKARTPYTEVFALFGMKKEQFSKLLHTQNISRQWNIALNMLRIRSEGFYQRQNCTDNNIALTTNYVSKNNRYSLLANGIISSIKKDENGGILHDSLFEENLNINKKLMSVNLKNARSKNRNREVYLKQSMYFGKKENILTGDSVTGKRIRPDHSISYSFHASDEEFAYSESQLDTGYYENTFFDSLQTKDSTHIETFKHALGISTTLFRKVRIYIDTEQNNRRLVQYNKDSSRVLDSSFAGHSIHIVLSNNTGTAQKLRWRTGKQYIINGPFEFDDHVYGQIDYTFKNKKQIKIDINTTSRAVPFLYNHYISNHFSWKNNFETVYETNLSLLFKDQKNKLSFGTYLSQINGYVYFDSTFLPKQYDTLLDIRTIFAQKNFRLKHFGLENFIRWQDVSAEEVLRLPEIITNHSIYYIGKWFKRAVDIQLGFDITYYTSYYGDAYMPALGQYYLQNEKKLGNYPFIDFFFNMKIKNAFVFFKSEHVNSGFSGANYYLAPHIPGPDRSIKIGVKWKFFD